MGFVFLPDSFSLSFRVPELLVQTYRCLVLTSSIHLEGLAGIAWISEPRERQDNLRQSEDGQSPGGDRLRNRVYDQPKNSKV